jgi:hypothetical protein
MTATVSADSGTGDAIPISVPISRGRRALGGAGSGVEVLGVPTEGVGADDSSLAGVASAMEIEDGSGKLVNGRSTSSLGCLVDVAPVECGVSESTSTPTGRPPRPLRGP